MKTQLLNILSGVLNKSVIYFLKKIVVLKPIFYSNPNSHFNTPNEGVYGEVCTFFKSLLLKLAVTFPENYVLKCAIYKLNVVSIY